MSNPLKPIETASAPTFSVQICIAGDPSVAAQTCRKFCYDVGYCVTLTKTEYIYKGGQEAGVIIGLINYPRFPLSPIEILQRAEMLGMLLMEDMFQQSFSIVTPADTVWYSRRDA